MKTETNQNERNRAMTYGIKKMNGTTTRILTDAQGFIDPMFVGIGALAPKTWKTRKGADKAAQRHGAETFTITDTMNY